MNVIITTLVSKIIVDSSHVSMITYVFVGDWRH